MIHLLFNTPKWARVGNLSDDQLTALSGDGVPLIDIRRDEEWEQTGVIEDSHLITFFHDRDKYDLDGWLAEFDKVADRDRPFILVCRNGIRTAKLGRFLDGRQDFSNVHHLHHGISAWIEAGRPVRFHDPE